MEYDTEFGFVTEVSTPEGGGVQKLTWLDRNAEAESKAGTQVLREEKKAEVTPQPNQVNALGKASVIFRTVKKAASFSHSVRRGVKTSAES